MSLPGLMSNTRYGENNNSVMRKILLSFSLLSLGICAMGADMPSGRTQLQDYRHDTRQNMRKANETASIEGTWRFKLGDYYFDDSSMETLEYDYEASFFNNILYFEEPDNAVLPMASHLNEATGELTFNAGQFGDFAGYGILVQQPSFYNPEKEAFEARSVTAQYDAERGIISFPENAAMQWWLYDYTLEPMFPLDGYTFEGAIKIVEEKPLINGIVINKGNDNEMSVMFKDFSRIDFRDGNIVFDNAEGLTIPLKDLVTIHFDELSDLSSVEAVIDETVRLIYTDGTLRMTGLPEGAPLDIYALSGAKAISIGAYNAEPIDISGLAKGVYVVTSAGHSFKFIK